LLFGKDRLVIQIWPVPHALSSLFANTVAGEERVQPVGSVRCCGAVLILFTISCPAFFFSSVSCRGGAWVGRDMPRVAGDGVCISCSNCATTVTHSGGGAVLTLGIRTGFGFCPAVVCVSAFRLLFVSVRSLFVCVCVCVCVRL
jgi:hypothetical protein